ncbi:thioredoxin-disulfide reductase [Desulfosoma caldarium]|uniref:Thioredoxin reductase n=1 Tax=Desulfosoma caldarium TaxID=610254 RepID=A0A3N1UR14_9BACT|nr:thioredoxin-disulfide reductase [Desulfosoma caldarium]ROQ93552.1 thioredoxin reductase (NADPH) [Desulfosoma caldarium]
MTSPTTYDMVIVGGGPAGLTAALYASRARYKTLLVERIGLGGQLLTYEKVDNYPGFPEGITTFELTELFKAQGLRFGMEHRSVEVTGLDLSGTIKVLHTPEGPMEAKAVIIATGCTPRKLQVKGEAEFTGRGVSYCAICDGPFYRNEEVAVIGGGDTAVEEAVYLTKFASHVHIIHRRNTLRAVKILQEEALANPKITVHWNRIVTEIQGGPQGVTGLVLQDTVTNASSELNVSGVFVFVGLVPNTQWVPEDVHRDALGFLITDNQMATSVPGVYAAGDVRSKSLRQIVTAVGDGATAAFCAGRYVESLAHHG